MEILFNRFVAHSLLRLLAVGTLWMIMWDNIVACTKCTAMPIWQTHTAATTRRSAAVHAYYRWISQNNECLDLYSFVLEPRRGNPLTTTTTRLGAVSCLQIHCCLVSTQHTVKREVDVRSANFPSFHRRRRRRRTNESERVSSFSRSPRILHILTISWILEQLINYY